MNEVKNTMKIGPECLGNKSYKEDYNLKYAYAAGAMAHGIASRELVVKMGRAGMIGYFGTGGLKKNEIESAIIDIQQHLKNGEAYGMNLLRGSRESEMIDLLLKYKVRNIEAASYVEVTPQLVHLRLSGLKQQGDGAIFIPTRIMVKVSRPEVANAFLRPPEPQMIEKLLSEGLVTKEEAILGRSIPMVDDICVEADSGGHSDHGVAFALLPTILRKRNELMKQYGYLKNIRVGAAGGIGTPEAAAAAFILGADFILTGSINQCTVESAANDIVKDMLQSMNVQDTVYAPAGDLFETGAKVQVLKKGVFFPLRANILYDLYRYHNSLDEIDVAIKEKVERSFFRKSFNEICEDVASYYSWNDVDVKSLSPKQKMAYVFRWYFGFTAKLAIHGVKERQVDFQIHTGPALGAFNQWVKGSGLENWRNRFVDDIGIRIMTGAADILSSRVRSFLQYR
ncbi:PfaD family polyunsaturated fatty acid/polyketide biosynthesis protein [Chitinophaga sp. Mgbs1]|uniref:PfaD family polyunsaturated fatty acid/polyketide biosynthesis protein n=1 Tax=Chitinophaga solisilvae TaxID=1233460 RepID=A0A9Q5GPE9_9BACT|nr:PfaD family polyunsaturated fatty acid/polyketide biosynthesis protein [Chitinophaga solisilvae]